ncbi:MAG: Xaa-Pro dipeptidase [Gaiellaceae bacterium]|nr:Xaa-Pro dipeptidase [Gaiellaceae bacterium]
MPLPPRITADEFRARQDRARAAAQQRGLDGLLVWSRGGHTTDRFYDVHWLAGYTSQFPFIPDGPGWSARSHAALILPVDGPSTLIADMPAFREDLATADRVEHADDVVVATGAALAEAVPGGRIGLVGADTLAFGWHAALQAAVRRRLEPHEDLGWRLRLVKSPAEQELLRAASAIGSLAVEAVMASCVAGATEAEAAAAGIAIVVAAGAAFHGISISSGPYAHHYAQSQPAPYDARRPLVAGDMARVDLYGSVDGYLFDFGRSRVVSRPPDQGQQALLDAVRETTLAGLDAVRPGATVGDIGRACDDHWAGTELVRLGLATPTGFAAWGHSTSLCWEEPWITAGSDIVLEPGMCLCVEKRQPVPGVGGANFEETVLVTDTGYELLTTAPRTFG